MWSGERQYHFVAIPAWDRKSLQGIETQNLKFFTGSKKFSECIPNGSNCLRGCSRTSFQKTSILHLKIWNSKEAINKRIESQKAGTVIITTRREQCKMLSQDVPRIKEDCQLAAVLCECVAASKESRLLFISVFRVNLSIARRYWASTEISIFAFLGIPHIAECALRTSTLCGTSFSLPCNKTSTLKVIYARPLYTYRPSPYLC